MRTLDRYVIREVLAPFALALLVFTFILIIPFIIQQAETMVAKGVAWPTILRLMVTLVPQALGLTIPMSLLVGLLVALGRLSGDREVVAMQACGLSPLRLLRPAGILAVLAWAATSWVLIQAIPDGNQTFREITTRLVADRAESEVKPLTFFEDFPGFVVYVRDVPATGGWNGVLAADTRSPERTVYYLARHGRMLVDRGQRVIQLVLTDGAWHSTSSRDPDGYEVVKFSETILPLDPESVFPRTGPARGDRELTIAELRARIAEAEARGESSHNQQLEIHTKFSIPFACFVFALIGVALGATDRRDGKLASFVLGLGVIFVYYAVMYLGQSMAKGQYMSPGVARWLPNALLGLAGAVAMWRRLRPVRRAGGGPVRALVTWLTTHLPRGRMWMPRIPDLPWLRPPLLDLYVATLYLRVLALCVAGMTGLFYLATFIDLSDKLFKGTATGGMLVAYFWWSTPQFLYYVIALAVLMAAVVTVGALTKSSELIVMRACGISLYRTAVPLLVSALVASGGLFALEELVLAPANRRARELDYLIRGQTPKSFDNVLTRRWLTGADGRVYHYASYAPTTRELNGLTVLTFNDDASGVRRRSFARVAVADAAQASGNPWHAREGWTRTFDDHDAVASFDRFTEGPLTLEAPEAFITRLPRPEQMNYGELERFIDGLRAGGLDVRQHEVALYRKVAFPFVTLVMTLIGVPFAITTGRRGAMYGVGIGIVLALVYWTMISVFAAFGAGGLMPPLLAAWAPNAIFGACAVYMLLTVRT